MVVCTRGLLAANSGISFKKLGVGCDEKASWDSVTVSNLALEGFFAYGCLFRAVYCGCTDEKTVEEESMDFWLNYFC